MSTDSSPDFHSLPARQMHEACSSIVKMVVEQPLGQLHVALAHLTNLLHEVHLAYATDHGPSENLCIFLTHYLHPSLEALLRRVYLDEGVECDRVKDIVRLVLRLAVRHIQETTVSPVTIVPTVAQLSSVLVQPIVPIIQERREEDSAPVKCTSETVHSLFATPSAPAAPSDGLVPVEEQLGCKSPEDSIAPMKVHQAAHTSALSTISSEVQAIPDITTPPVSSTDGQSTNDDRERSTVIVTAPASPPSNPATMPTSPRSSVSSNASSRPTSPAAESRSPSLLTLSRTMTPNTSALHAKTSPPHTSYACFFPFLNTINNDHFSEPARQPQRVSLDAPLFDCLELVLDPTSPFYQKHGLTFAPPRAPLGIDYQSGSEAQSQHSEWLASLAFPCLVDIYLRGRWITAEVLDYHSQHHCYTVQCLGQTTVEGQSATVRQETIDRPEFIQPLHSKSQLVLPANQQWRAALAEDTQIDALDTVSKWYTGSVLEVRGDLLRVNYDGWTNKYDEFIPRYSERLAPHLSRARGGKDTGGVPNFYNENNGVEELMSLNTPAGTNTVAVWRGRDSGSYHLVDALNDFAAFQGFGWIVHRIFTRSHSPLPVPQLKKLVLAVSHGINFYHHPFLSFWAPFLRCLAFATLLDLTDIELRSLSKDQLDDCVKIVTKFNFPLYKGNLRVLGALVEEFSLACAVKRLKCAVVERRINGMAHLIDYLLSLNLRRLQTHTAFSSDGAVNLPQWLSPPQIIAYIEDNQLLQSIFSAQTGHHELMKRSADLLKFLANHSALENRHLSLIWSALSTAIKKDDEVQLTVLYRLLDDLAWHLSPAHIAFIFSCVEAIPFSEYSLQTLDLIRELTKWTTHKHGASGAASQASSAKRAMRLLWDLHCDPSTSRDLSRAAIVRIEEIIKARSSQRIDYLELYASMLKDRQHALSCLKLLQQLIEACPEYASSLIETQTRSSVLEFLQSNYQIVDASLEDLKSIKSQAKAMIDAGTVDANLINNATIDSHTNYIAHIRERFQWLNFLLINGQPNISLNSEQLDELWSLCHDHALSASERETFHRWLKQCIVNTQGQRGKSFVVLNDTLIEHVFMTTLLPSLSTAAAIESLTLQHWAAFEAFFYHVNYTHKKLNGTSIDDLTVISEDFSLIGLPVIWRVAFECKRSEVSSKAIALLNALHENVSTVVANDTDSILALGEVRRRYLSVCMKHLEEYCQVSDWKRSLRCLSSLHSLLDVSDRKGIVGKRRSHSRQSQGRVFKLVIQNNIRSRRIDRHQHSKFDVLTHANDTLAQLRQNIALRLDLPVNSLKMFGNGQDLKQEHLAQSLESLGLKNGHTVLVSKRNQQASRVPLLDSREEVTPLLRSALTAVFLEFAHGVDDDGPYMSVQDMANYIRHCLRPNCLPQRDHQILTDRGFLSHREMTAMTARCGNVMVACPVRVASGQYSVEYCAVTARELVESTSSELVEMRSNDGSVDLVVTADHRMLVRDSLTLVSAGVLADQQPQSVQLLRYNDDDQHFVASPTRSPSHHSHSRSRSQSDLEAEAFVDESDTVIHIKSESFTWQPLATVTRLEGCPPIAVWCVHVPTEEHLVIARRVTLTDDGRIVAASRPVVTGNSDDIAAVHMAEEHASMERIQAIFAKHGQRIQIIQPTTSMAAATANTNTGTNTDNAQSKFESESQSEADDEPNVSDDDWLTGDRDGDDDDDDENGTDETPSHRVWWAAFKVIELSKGYVHHPPTYESVALAALKLIGHLDMPPFTEHLSESLDRLNRFLLWTNHDEPYNVTTVKLPRDVDAGEIVDYLRSWQDEDREWNWQLAWDILDLCLASQNTRLARLQRDNFSDSDTSDDKRSQPSKLPGLVSVGSHELPVLQPVITVKQDGSIYEHEDNDDNYSPSPTSLQSNRSRSLSLTMNDASPSRSQSPSPAPMIRERLHTRSQSQSQSNRQSQSQPQEPLVRNVMRLEGFLAFYREACVDRLAAVWNDLHLLGFTDSLKRKESLSEELERQQEAMLESSLSRTVLSDNSQYFEQFFGILSTAEHREHRDEDTARDERTLNELAQSVWQLLQRLPTWPAMLHSLAELPSPSDWQQWITDASHYRMLYALQCFDVLTEPINTLALHQLHSDDSLLGLIDPSHWSERFLDQGGFQRVYQLFVNFANKVSTVNDSELHQQLLALLLKLLHCFITAALSAAKPELSTVERLRSFSEDLSEQERRQEQSQIQNEAERQLEDALTQLSPHEQPVQTEESAPTNTESGDASSASEESGLVVLPVLFIALVGPNMSSAHATDILAMFDAADLLGLLWRQLIQCASRVSIDDECLVLVEHALNIIVSLTLYQPIKLFLSLYSLVMADEDADFFVILYCESPRFRRLFARSILQLCRRASIDGSHVTSVKPPTQFFLSLLDRHFPSQDSSQPNSSLECDEYFWLLGELIQPARTNIDGEPSPQSSSASASLAPVLDSLCQRLTQYESSEVSEEYHDKVLAGILSLIRTILIQCPEYREMVGVPATSGESDKETDTETDAAAVASDTSSENASVSSEETTNVPVSPTSPESLSAPPVQSTHPSPSPSAHNLVDVLFTDYLFGHPSTHSAWPKCKTRASRQLAFQLLHTLILQTSANLHRLCALLMNEYSGLTHLTVLDYNAEKLVKSPHGHIGLRNLGSTCYMNSLLQQLFMMPRLRAALWLASLESPLTCQELQKEGKLSALLETNSETPATTAAMTTTCPRFVDDLLTQLQLMFAFLSESEKQFYDTQFFCHSYKDERGLPINVRIQQDAQEFFNVLLDRVEKKLGVVGSQLPSSLSPLSTLIQSTFGGSLVNQLVCHSCHSVKESTETFYSLSLQVANKPHMHESLEQYVLGETLSDFNCSFCSKRVDITKRVCLGSLPDTVVFHLKRFELNYETFQHEKLNHRFVFPIIVDLWPYTKTGILSREAKSGAAVVNDSQCVYECVGILVHTGTASGGHYYSFIQDRASKEWLEFNDHTIRAFDPSTIDEHCYGGENEVNERTAWGTDMVTQQEKVKNAYMLVYERVKPSSAKPSTAAVSENANEHQHSGNGSTTKPESVDLVSSAVTVPASHLIPPSMLREVLADNVQFRIDRNLLNPQFYHFLTACMEQMNFDPCITPLSDEQLASVTSDCLLRSTDCATDNPSLNFTLSTIKMFVLFGLDGLARLAENKPFSHYCQQLLRLVSINLPACQWLLEHFVRNTHTINDLMLTCRDFHVRRPLVELFTAALRVVGTIDTFESLYHYRDHDEHNRIIYDTALAQQQQQHSALPGSPRHSSVAESPSPRVAHRAYPSVTTRFFHAYYSLWPELPKHWMRFSEYFELLYQFAGMSHAHRWLLINRNLVAMIGDLFLGDSSPIWNDRKRRRPVMGNVVAQPDWTPAINTLVMLACCCHTEANPPQLSPFYMGEPNEVPLNLGPDDLQVIKARLLYARCLESNTAVPMIAQLAAHWSWYNLGISEAVIDIILAGISKFDSENDKPYFDAITCLAVLNDGFRTQRFQRVFGSKSGLIAMMMRYQVSPQRKVLDCLQFIIGLQSSSNMVELDSVLVMLRPEWLWLDHWLLQHCYLLPHRRSSFTANQQSAHAQQQRAVEKSEVWRQYVAMIESLGLTLDGQVQPAPAVTIGIDGSPSSEDFESYLAQLDSSGLSRRAPKTPTSNKRNKPRTLPPAQVIRATVSENDSRKPNITDANMQDVINQVDDLVLDRANTGAAPSVAIAVPSDSDAESGDGFAQSDMQFTFNDSSSDGEHANTRDAARTPGQRQRRYGLPSLAPPVSPREALSAAVQQQRVNGHKRNRNRAAIDFSHTNIVVNDDDSDIDYSQPPLMDDETSEPLPEWGCSVCTFLNSGHRHRCEMCDTQREAAAH